VAFCRFGLPIDDNLFCRRAYGAVLGTGGSCGRDVCNDVNAFLIDAGILLRTGRVRLGAVELPQTREERSTTGVHRPSDGGFNDGDSWRLHLDLHGCRSAMVERGLLLTLKMENGVRK
jgi:hypothetical protein